MVQGKNKRFRTILLAVLMIPVILVFIMILSFSSFSSSTGVTGFTSFAIDEYLKEKDNPQLEKWLNGLNGFGKDFGRAYVLRQVDKEEGQVTVNYLIYMPRLEEDSRISAGTSSGLSGRTLKLKIEDSSDNGGNTLLLVTCSGEPAPKLKLYFNDKRVDCEITDVDYPLNDGLL